MQENTVFSVLNALNCNEHVEKKGNLSHTLTVKQAGSIAVTSIELNKTSLALKEGASETLTATVKPDNATDKTVTWSSSDEIVATINQEGKLKAEKEGSAIITAKVGEKTAKCEVVVSNYPVGNINFEDAQLKQILVGKFDANSDGELSYREAANVTDLNNVISIKTVTSFNELQYFTGLKAIPRDCFLEWKSLTSIILPESILSIDDFAFAGCTSLKSLVIPNNVTSIGEYTFQNCSSLSSIIVPESVSWIDRRAFYNCTSLSSIVLPETVPFLVETFFGCSMLTSVNIPKTVTELRGSFMYCSNLSSLVIPSNVTSLEGTFEGCTKLSFISIPESIKRIGSRTFRDCSSLKTIDIPKSVEEIDYYHTFQGCSSLTSVSILETTSYIGDKAFEGCTSLTSTVVIPENVTMLGGSLFDRCENLQAVILKPLTPPELRYIDGNSGFPFDWINLIYVPSSSVDVYKESWKDYKDRIHSIDELE